MVGINQEVPEFQPDKVNCLSAGSRHTFIIDENGDAYVAGFIESFFSYEGHMGVDRDLLSEGPNDFIKVPTVLVRNTGSFFESSSSPDVVVVPASDPTMDPTRIPTFGPTDENEESKDWPCCDRSAALVNRKSMEAPTYFPTTEYPTWSPSEINANAASRALVTLKTLPAPKFEKVYAGAGAPGDSRDMHSLLIDRVGNVYTTGHNDKGQLCHGDFESRDVFQKVELPDESGGAVAAAVGLDFTLILLRDGRVFGCGSNENGEIGLGPNIRFVDTPTRIKGLSDIEDVSAGLNFGLYLKRSSGKVSGKGGKVFGSGSNLFSQLCESTDGDTVDVPMVSRLQYCKHKVRAPYVTICIASRRISGDDFFSFVLLHDMRRTTLCQNNFVTLVMRAIQSPLAPKTRVSSIVGSKIERRLRALVLVLSLCSLLLPCHHLYQTYERYLYQSHTYFSLYLLPQSHKIFPRSSSLMMLPRSWLAENHHTSYFPTDPLNHVAAMTRVSLAMAPSSIPMALSGSTFQRTPISDLSALVPVPRAPSLLMTMTWFLPRDRIIVSNWASVRLAQRYSPWWCHLRTDLSMRRRSCIFLVAGHTPWL